MKKINISIDDVSPHPKSSLRVVDNCNIVLESFPDAKITLFVPVAYWRTVRPNIATQSPLLISQHIQFCEALKNLPKENYELAYHGYYHGIPNQNDNDEFRDINYDQAKNLFEKMFEEAKKANVYDEFKKIFRPPAWRMNPDVFEASKDVGIKILALTDLDYAKETYKEQDLKYKHVTYSNIFPPFRELKLEGSKTGIVYHACEWDRNYLSSEKANELVNFLHQCDEKDFVFMEDII